MPVLRLCNAMGWAVIPAQGEALVGKYADQLGPDLVQAAAVSLTFLVKYPRQFRRDLQVRLRLLLDLDIHHFLDQGDKINWLHEAKCSNRRASFEAFPSTM